MPQPDGLNRRALIGWGAVAMAALPVSAKAVIDTPQATFDAYRDLINRHDFDLLQDRVMSDHPIFVFANKRHDGLDAARAAFMHTWSILPDEVYSMSGEKWLFIGRDHAACTFAYAYRGTMADGRALSGGGQGLNIFTLTPKGWRLSFEQLTPDT